MMKNALTLIFLIVLIAPIISAQNITVDYPDKVQVEEEISFSIKLTDFQEDIYDVKIDITLNGERVSKILNNGEWKSTYYYVNDAMNQNEEKIFSLKIGEGTGIGNIVIKIRDSGGNVKTFSDYEISIGQSLEEIDEINEDYNYTTNNETNGTSFVEETAPESAEKINNEESGTKVIKLEPKDIKTETTNEKLDIGKYAIYGFVAFCILLAFLFALRKIKPDKNEFD